MAAVMAAALIPTGAAQDAGGVRHRVEIQRFRFVPERLVVAPGDTLVWVNLDSVPHTLTAQDESWDSQALKANKEWELRVTEGMTGDYFCRYHPRMQGQVQVSRP
jgi:plastocyanin